MQFTVIGAGAIGGTIGAHLARSGHEVLLVDSAADHVHAIERTGLTIEGRTTFRVRVPAVTVAGLADALRGRPPEAVLLAVKAMHTAAALEPVAPLLGPESFVVSMQNGLNEKVIAGRIGAARTVGAFVNFGADYLEPGRIMYGGAGALYLGELDGRMTPRLEALGRVLRESFLENTTLTPNIWGYLWGKLGYGAILFATATVDETMADVLGDLTCRPALATIRTRCASPRPATGPRSTKASTGSPSSTATPSSRRAGCGATWPSGAAAPRWITRSGRWWRWPASTGSRPRSTSGWWSSSTPSKRGAARWPAPTSTNCAASARRCITEQREGGSCAQFPRVG